MKILKYFLTGTVCLALCACGGKKSTEESDEQGSENNNRISLKIETQLGELGEYMTPSENEVIIKINTDTEDGSPIYKLQSSLPVKVKKGVANDFGYGFEAVVLDNDHIEIAELPEFEIESELNFDNGDLHNVLNAGNVRAILDDSMSEGEFNKFKNKWDKITKEGVYLILKPRWENAVYAPYERSNSGGTSYSTDDDYDVEIASDEEEVAASSKSSSSSSKNWNALLDSYEQYVDKYISYMKKAANGDVSALSEYPSLMQKAQEFSEQLENAKGDMTPAQWARYMKITQKMMNAAQNM